MPEKSSPAEPFDIDAPGYYERVYEIVRRIPTGRVMTYGQIADILGEGYTPRTVGYVMNKSPEDVPWHRVINSQGKCSTGRVVLPSNKQQSLLEAEGITFDAKERCDLNLHRWWPDGTGQTGAADDSEESQPSLFND